MSNPQKVMCAAFEAITFQVTMSPATNISGQNFQLNVRDRNKAVLIASTVFSITDSVNGVFTMPLATSQTGTTLGIGDFDYDIWRTDAGFEKRLVYGELLVGDEQWQ